MQKNRPIDYRPFRPSLPAGAGVLSFGIACCGLAIAIVVAVAVALG